MEIDSINLPNLKQVLNSKVTESIKNSTTNNNYRVQLKDFSEIKHLNTGNLHLIYHPVYKNVNIYNNSNIIITHKETYRIFQ